MHAQIVICHILCRYRMPTTQQFAYFFAFVGAGLVFMVIAFSIFLPVIVLAPSKFALSFTLGSILVMSGFAALRGWKQQASHMFSAARLPFTAGMACKHCACHCSDRSQLNQPCLSMQVCALNCCSITFLSCKKYNPFLLLDGPNHSFERLQHLCLLQVT